MSASPETTVQVPAPGRTPLAEVLATLSYAFDLTEGQPLGHSVRSCMIGMRFADELNLAPADRSALYYALLLKDAGCSSNATHMSALFDSDDRFVKSRMKHVDWQHRARLAMMTARMVARGRSPMKRIAQTLGVASRTDAARELTRMRAERGAEIARGLGFPDATADAIRALDERWDGSGHPEGLEGEAIPLLARIASLAQMAEAFHDEVDADAAVNAAWKRRGKWFDPRLVDMLAQWRDDEHWWGALRRREIAKAAVALEPPQDSRTLEGSDLDHVAQAFAEIIDAKSAFTHLHSTRVAAIAEAIVAEMGFDDSVRVRVRRAGLLHDIGKLGVSTQILDKTSALTTDEQRKIQRHPYYTWEILRRVSAFADVSHMASLHHERLDGSGYPWQATAEALDWPTRALCVADVYVSITTNRPYRPALTPQGALDHLEKDRGTKLCPAAIDALAAHLEQQRPAERDADLTNSKVASA